MTAKSIGDTVTYRRNSDGTLVTGCVAAVRRREEDEQSDRPWRCGLFTNAQLRDEDVAYILDLNPEDLARVGHPVTIGHSRIINKDINNERT